MHRLNIFLSCFGHSGWAGSFFCLFRVLTLTLLLQKIFQYCIILLLPFQSINRFHFIRKQSCTGAQRDTVALIQLQAWPSQTPLPPPITRRFPVRVGHREATFCLARIMLLTSIATPLMGATNLDLRLQCRTYGEL
ncbi:hypothetical protein BD779DRAFT_1747974 [Infundibulicybe gibba]|nr:hypothetical protein BD779DRAFT_1747974 [Infundibulicybe gibba]